MWQSVILDGCCTCRVCSLKGWKDERKWIKAAENINFTKEQRTRVLAFREEALAKLKKCTSGSVDPAGLTECFQEHQVCATCVMQDHAHIIKRGVAADCGAN